MTTNGTWRFATALTLLIVAAGSALVFLIAADLVVPTQVVGSWAVGRELLDNVGDASGAERAAILAGSFLLGILFLGILLRTVGPQQRTASLHMLVADDQGFVVVDSRGVEAIARQAAAAAHGVVEADVQVRGGGTSALRLRTDIGVFPGADVKRTGNEVRQGVREAIDNLVGLEVSDVTVAVHVLAPDQLTRLLE